MSLTVCRTLEHLTEINTTLSRIHSKVLLFSIEADELKNATIRYIKFMRRSIHLPEFQYSDVLAARAQRDSKFFTFPRGKKCVYHPYENCSDQFSAYYCEYNRVSRLTPTQMVKNATDKWFNGIDTYIFPGENLNTWECLQPDYKSIAFVFMMSRRLVRVGCGKTDFNPYQTDSSFFCYFEFDFQKYSTDFSDYHFLRICRYEPRRLHYCKEAPTTDDRCKLHPFYEPLRPVATTPTTSSTQSVVGAGMNKGGNKDPAQTNNKAKNYGLNQWKIRNKTASNGVGFPFPAYLAPHRVLFLISSMISVERRWCSFAAN